MFSQGQTLLGQTGMAGQKVAVLLCPQLRIGGLDCTGNACNDVDSRGVRPLPLEKCQPGVGSLTWAHGRERWPPCGGDSSQLCLPEAYSVASWGERE